MPDSASNLNARDISLKGVIPIILSPFESDSKLCLDGISTQVEYCISAGAKAVAAPLVVSEFHTLTDAERGEIYKATVQAADGRIKVLAGVSGVSIVHAALLGAMAADAGVDGLIATPPSIAKLHKQEVVRYFQEIANASQLPLMIQNAPPPTGGSISNTEVEKILETNKYVFSVKQELHPDTHTISKTLELTARLNLPVYGGKGGMYLLSELARGSSGTMPASPLTQELVEVCDLFWNDEIEAARRAFEAALPMINLMMLYGPIAGKMFLYLAGVLSSPYGRDVSAKLDKYDIKDIEKFLENRKSL